jgi:hypothetical protein
MAIKGGFTAQSVKTMACGEGGKMDGRKRDPSTEGLYLWVRNNNKHRAYTYRYDLNGKSYEIALGSGIHRRPPRGTQPGSGTQSGRDGDRGYDRGCDRDGDRLHVPAGRAELL